MDISQLNNKAEDGSLDNQLNNKAEDKSQDNQLNKTVPDESQEPAKTTQEEVGDISKKITDDDNIKLLLNRIHEKNKITVKKDDPIIILITCFEYLLEFSDKRLETKTKETIQTLHQVAIDSSKDIEIKFNDAIIEAIRELLEAISKKNKKEFEDYTNLLSEAKIKLETQTTLLDNQITWIRSMVWFNLLTAIIICFATLIFVVKIL